MNTAPRPATLRRSFRKEYPVAVRGEGAWIFDAQGKRYLDLAGSAAVNLIGHGDQAVARAMQDQLAQIEFVHSSLFTTRVTEEFAQQVLAFAGPAFEGGAVFFTSGGSESIETALKLARQYQVELGQTHRTQILARDQAYHGATFGAMAVSGNRKRREIYLRMLPSCPRVNTPYCYRCIYGCDECATKYAAEVEQQLEFRGDELAAFIFEPISGATLGAVAPPNGYMQRVTDACQNAGVLVIADEVMTGFGRTGANFAVDHWGVAPDLLVVAKGIASGYAPLGAVIANRKLVGAIASGSGGLIHGFTYNAHPVAVAAGRAVFSKLQGEGLIRAANSEIADSPAAHLKTALLRLRDCTSVGDVRGRGLLWGIEFVRDKQTKAPYAPEQQFAPKIAEAGMRRGLVLYPMQGCVDGLRGDHLLIAPPATLTPDEISWAAQQLRESIEDVQQMVGS